MSASGIKNKSHYAIFSDISIAPFYEFCTHRDYIDNLESLDGLHFNRLKKAGQQVTNLHQKQTLWSVQWSIAVVYLMKAILG